MLKALWAYADCLSAEQCARVIGHANSLRSNEATIGDERTIDTKVRKSSVRWIYRQGNAQMAWLFQMLDEAVWTMNRHWHGVEYDKDACPAIQYTEYRAGEFYNRHVDTIFRPRDMVQRKISCSVLLSDPSEFEGGDLYIQRGTMEPDKVSIGQIYTFPSILSHEVRPVTRGVRRGLVCWYQGMAWR